MFVFWGKTPKVLLVELIIKGSVGFLSNSAMNPDVLFCKVIELYYPEPLAYPKKVLSLGYYIWVFYLKLSVCYWWLRSLLLIWFFSESEFLEDTTSLTLL